MIYYGSQYVPLGPAFKPPRPGTMPKRGPITALGLDDTELKSAMRQSESICHNPTGAYGRRYRRTKT